MKNIPEYRLLTRLFEIEHPENDLGIDEIIEFIKHMMDDNVMDTFKGEWISKFEKIEISFINFGGDLDDGRHNDNVILNVSKELVDELQELTQTELSEYDITYKEIKDIKRGELLIRFFPTRKY